MNRKDITKILRQLRQKGYGVVQSKGGHWKVYNGSRMVAVISFSPSAPQALMDIKRDLRKAGITL